MGTQALRECRVVLGRDPLLTVEQVSTGDLVCNVHRSQSFCSHIQKVIEEALDAGWPYEVSELLVPMVPDMDVWAKVEIDQAVVAGGRAVYVIRPKRSKSFVGYITPDEGRQVLRSMLHNWALPQFKEPGSRQEGLLECKAKRHGTKAEEALRNPPSQQFALANMWQIVAEGICLTCSQAFDPNDDAVKI